MHHADKMHQSREAGPICSQYVKDKQRNYRQLSGRPPAITLKDILYWECLYLHPNPPTAPSHHWQNVSPSRDTSIGEVGVVGGPRQWVSQACLVPIYHVLPRAALRPKPFPKLHSEVRLIQASETLITTPGHGPPFPRYPTGGWG